MDEKSARYKEIFKHCERYFFDHENPLFVIKTAQNFKEGYDAYGLDDEQLRALKYEVLDSYQPTPLEIAELGTIFFRTGKYEFGSLAILLLKKHRPRLTREIYEIVKGWLDKGVENWAHTDLLCSKITPVFLELNIMTLEDFKSWVSSPSKWSRRAAVTTLIHLIPHNSCAELLEIIQPLVHDKEHAVQQGLGWFLKRLWQISPKEVEDFLHLHKKKISSLAVDEATKKMTKDKKRKFRNPAKNAAKGNPPDREQKRSPHPKARNKPRDN